MPDQEQNHIIRFRPILSAHPSFSTTDPTADFSWRICLDAGSPSGLTLESTLGMQTRLVQVFPVFLDANNLPIRDPKPTYHLVENLPDQVQYQVNLYNDMDVNLILRVPDSHTLLGETQFTCKSSSEKKLQVGVCVRMSPLQNGQTMSAQQYHNQTILTGESGSLSPVLMSIGLPKLIHRPHPGLSVQLLVSARHPASYRWIISAGKTGTESREICSGYLKRSWSAMIKKASIAHNQRLITFQTGDPDLDEALQISQVQTQRMVFSPAGAFDKPFQSNSRDPEDAPLMLPGGTTTTGDPQCISVWELYYSIRNYLLPGFPELAAGMLQNILESQRRFGEVDLRPGISDLRSRYLAPPLLANCCQEIYQHSHNRQQLAEMYPALSAHIHRWIDSNHDLDQDRMPEWQSAEQTDWPENPLFDQWADHPTGYNCQVVETPELGALLYQECITMQQLAQELGKTDDSDHFQTIADEVKKQVEACWDPRKKIYRYRDQETHFTPGGSVISRGSGAGTFPIDRSFTAPSRLCLTLHAKQDTTRTINVDFIGKDGSAEHLIEQVPQNHMIWRDKHCTITSEHVFEQVESINLTGLQNRDEWTLQELDLEPIDMTLFLPLWAGIPTAENASRMVQFNLAPNWIEPNQFGVPMLLPGQHKARKTDSSDLLNTNKMGLLIEGLMRYGFYTEANKLVNGLMKAIIKSSQSDGQVYQRYHCLTGQGSGKTNHLVGFAPVGLYLRNLGIEIRSAQEIVVWGHSPYPQDIQIQYQGTRIIRSERDIEIQFQDGEKIHIDGPEKRIVHWRSTGGG
jgi:hypothetical protein